MKAKKPVLCIVVSLIGVMGFVMGAQSRVFFAREAGFAVEINGEVQTFEQPPLLVEQYTYLPVRDFCKKVGVEVEWDDDAKQVIIDTTARWKNGDPWATQGVLDSGREFIFDGRDSGFLFEEIKERSSLVEPIEKGLKSYAGGVPTVRMAAEVAENALVEVGVLRCIKAEDASLDVFFDKELDCWYAHCIGTGLDANVWVEIHRAKGQVSAYRCET